MGWTCISATAANLRGIERLRDGVRARFPRRREHVRVREDVRPRREPEVPAVRVRLAVSDRSAFRDLKHAGAGRVQVPSESRTVEPVVSATAKAARDAS